MQSSACLVLAAQGRIDFKTFLFCNVGEDSENPLTIAYYHEYAVPFAAEHGLDLIELRRQMRAGGTRTVLEEIVGQPKSVPFPVRLEGGGFGTRRCTDRFKIQVVGRWTKEHGATKEEPAIVGVGFSLDELSRATSAVDLAWQRKVYPLFDLRLTRKDCRQVIIDAGLPMPPKSSCYFCPFQSIEDWRRKAREQPEEFAKAVELEEMINERRLGMGKDRVWFSAASAPLPTVLNQGDLFDEGDLTCDSFSCMT